MILFLLHGWAYDSAYWDPLGLPEAVRGELGYFGAEPMLDFPEQPFIGVGHSLGFLRLLLDWPPAMRGLVGINGFARFCQGSDFPAGIPARVLARMKDKLAQDTSAVLGDFWERAGAHGPQAVPHLPRLVAGLEFLEKADGRTALARLAERILLLASREDPLAPGVEALGVHTAWHETGDHALARTDPPWCRAQIAAFAEAHVR
ncbi:MAG TPA: hypothetical protein VHL08_09305 [Dongiaceae bacterium]|jgi:pimeloyl-[acyl-carrier protein] methyl ester esterase|nr:hypothetical protein [Dongiaceae bacterium]